MNARIRFRVIPGVIILALAAGPVGAQQSDQPAPPSQPTVEQLSRQVEALTAQLEMLKQQLEQLQAGQEEARQKAELEQLRQAAATEAASTAPSSEIDTTTDFVSGTRMQPQLNPELSVTGDIFFVGGNHQEEELQARHFELDIQSYLDPYTFMHVVFGYHGHHRESDFGRPEDEEEAVHGGGMMLGEGYVTWMHIPGGLSLTVGKKRQQFGVLNRWHLHALDQTDLPWVLQESFGDHGLVGTGLSVDWLMPRLWADSNELTFEVTDGDNDVAFAGGDWRHPSFLARLKSFWDIGEDSYLEVGLDGMMGKADRDGDLDHDFYALDLAYNWYPAGRELYREFTVRGMILRSLLDTEEGYRHRAWGGYLYGQYKFSPHWIAGIRYDRVFDQREAGHDTWGFSPYLTFWQSEFVRLRGQGTYRHDNLFGIDRRFELQLTFAAGPHKHDSY